MLRQEDLFAPSLVHDAFAHLHNGLLQRQDKARINAFNAQQFLSKSLTGKYERRKNVSYSTADDINATFPEGWLHISEHSEQPFRNEPNTYFGLIRTHIPRLSEHF